MKLNPYEQGVADYNNRVSDVNPFPTFTQKWALYNRGYNTAMGLPKAAKTIQEYRDSQEPIHGCGHMQGRGAA